MKKKNNDFIVLGLALFAMFFGAGNLLFPPALGLVSGKSWVICAVGFFITAIGMPLLGIIAGAKAGGSVDDIGNKVGKLFSKIFAAIIILSIGPLLAIPRTGATTYEMGVKPIFPNVSVVLVSAVFFALTLYFVIKPSKMIDKIAKILTPALLLMILLIIGKGILSPIGTPSVYMEGSAISKGFTDGYQTMDALASLVFGIVILNSIKDKGYTNVKDQVSITIKAGIVAALGLAIVYGGLIYLGASSSGTFPADIPMAQLLMSITDTLLGSFGKVALGIVVTLACLTTSIGLTATVGNFFSNLTKGKLSYNMVVIGTSLFSGIFACIGVDSIVSIAVPLLVTVYPVAIVLIIMASIDELMPPASYPGAVLGAFLISLNDGLGVLNIKLGFLNTLAYKMPFSSLGFGWILPALIGGFVSTFILKSKYTNKAKQAS